MTDGPRPDLNPKTTGFPLPEVHQPLSHSFVRESRELIEHLDARLRTLTDEHGVVSAARCKDLGLQDPLRKVRAEQEYLRNTIRLAESEAIPGLSDKKRDWSSVVDAGSLAVPIKGYTLQIDGKLVSMKVKSVENIVLVAETLNERFHIYGADSREVYGKEPGYPAYPSKVRGFVEIGGFVAGNAQLTGTAARVAEEFFNQVRSGKSFTPMQGQRLIESVLVDEGERSSASAIMSRHYGQEYLASINPFRVDPGVLFGSGAVCNAYWYGSPENAAVVLEANRTDLATLVVTPEAFDRLSQVSRQEIRNDGDSIDGLIARIIHTPGADINESLRVEWQLEVDRVLAPYLE